MSVYEADDGRPAKRDREVTRAKVLEAAIGEFAAKGLAGARMDSIALRAGVSKRIPYYYFGSKAELFRASMRKKIDDYVATVGNPETQSADARQLSTHFEAYLADPELVRILIWEALEFDEAVTDDPERAATFDAWMQRIREAQTAGQFPRAFDPEQVVLCYIALSLFPVAFRHVTRLSTGQLPTDPGFGRDWMRFLGELNRHLSNGPEPHTAEPSG